MCLLTKQKIPTILEEDMVVYKRLSKFGDNPKEFESSCVGFKYTLGEKYVTKLVFDKKPDSFADEMVRNHYKFSDLDNKTFKQVASRMTNIHEGFHFYVTIKRLTDSYFKSFHTMVECVIPKGSEVFFDETGLGVTDTIIIKKIIEHDLVQ